LLQTEARNSSDIPREGTTGKRFSARLVKERFSQPRPLAEERAGASGACLCHFLSAKGGI
jgi:hypothetical protein